MGKDSGLRPGQPLAQNQNDTEGNARDNAQNNAMPGDPGDGQSVSDKRGSIGRTSVEKVPGSDLQNQATIEEFGEEGLGVAPKE